MIYIKWQMILTVTETLNYLTVSILTYSTNSNINNNQLILEGLIRTMPQLTERNQLM